VRKVRSELLSTFEEWRQRIGRAGSIYGWPHSYSVADARARLVMLIDQYVREHD